MSHLIRIKNEDVIGDVSFDATILDYIDGKKLFPSFELLDRDLQTAKDIALGRMQFCADFLSREIDKATKEQKDPDPEVLRQYVKRIWRAYLLYETCHERQEIYKMMQKK
jgi:hypothetical protein